MKVRILEDCGWCDGVRVMTGDVVDLTETAAQDFLAQGKAEPIVEAKAKEEVETAAAEPPENAAKRTARPQARKRD